MDKNPRDQVSQASWTLLEAAKDTTATNIMASIRAAQLDIKPDQLQKLLMIVDASIEEGYHKGHKTFMKQIEKALYVVTLPPIEAARGKKKQL
jgi:hypothetical protein